jgi:hypothetical protein
MTTETASIAASIDETRRTAQWRDHDGRPDAHAFKSRGRTAPEVVRAQTRLRTADWRNRMDRKKSPDSREIGMSLVYALITSKLSEMTYSDHDLVARMLTDLQARGYDVVEAKKTLRRMRNRYVDPVDRQDEPSESTGAQLRLSGEADDLPF